MLKPFLFLSAAALFALAPTLIPATGASPQDAGSVKITPAIREKAKEVYKVDCAVCHGDNGNGKTDLATSMNVTLDDWTDPKSLASMSDKDIFNIIRKGKGDKMPPEDVSRAKDEDIWAMIAYIRDFSKGQPSVPAPASPAAPAAPAPAPAAPASPGK
jgi:mono/diheme cytochrome c family protein